MRKRLALINWFGGKGLMVDKLLAYVPDHKLYCEVFGGGAALLLNKKPAPVEVYNDIDGELVNLYRVMRDERKFERFQRMANFTLYSRKEFDDLKNATFDDDVERAWAFFVRMKMSFSGMGKSWSAAKISRRGMSLRVSAWLSTVDMLEEIHERLRTVQAECLPFEECIQKYDGEDTFFYLDPPYVHSTRTCEFYAHEMTDEDHERLVDMILDVKGKVMLSGYENEIYEELERNGWWKVCFEMKTRVANKPKVEAGKRVECIWMNYGVDTLSDVCSGGNVTLANV